MGAIANNIMGWDPAWTTPANRVAANPMQDFKKYLPTTQSYQPPELFSNGNSFSSMKVPAALDMASYGLGNGASPQFDTPANPYSISSGTRQGIDVFNMDGMTKKADAGYSMLGNIGGPMVGGGGTQPRGFMDNMIGYRDKDGSGTNGWGSLALNAGQGLMNAYLGMQMYGVAKDTLAHNKDQFNKNYAAQVATTNARQQDMINSRSGLTQAEKDSLYTQRKIGG